MKRDPRMAVLKINSTNVIACAISYFLPKRMFTLLKSFREAKSVRR